MQSIRPTFLGIGAHKAGTTWLCHQLRLHTQIWMPPMKELHFFDCAAKYPSQNDLLTASPVSRALGTNREQRERTYRILRQCIRSARKYQFGESLWWSKLLLGYYNESWYRSLFSQAAPDQITGEITPAYAVLDSEDVAKIKNVNPNIRLIFIIRNPIDRAWSAMRFSHRKGRLDYNLDSSEQIIAELKRPGKTLRGDYERTLDVYLKHFDSSQILVCFYDAIQGNPIELLSGITSFLDIADFEESSINNKKRINQSPLSPMPLEVRDFLCETYSPSIARLAKQFGSYASLWKAELDSHSSISDGSRRPDRLLPVIHP